MPDQRIYIIDLHFLGFPGAIASYLVSHAHGAVLVECGPSSTLPALQAGLKAHGFAATDITDVLLTHIHLDHAGAAGWLARQGARIHVHPAGASHLLNPEKLLASASRIYGEAMQTLWGEFLPVPPERLRVPQDGDDIEIGTRIVTVCDSFDAMTTHRPYRRAMGIGQALKILQTHASRQFDAQLVDTFIDLLEKKTLVPKS